MLMFGPMTWNYTKSVAILVFAGFLLRAFVYPESWAPPGEAVNYLGAGVIFLLPVGVIADLVAAWRYRRALRRGKALTRGGRPYG